jgi:tetratricopeptide (TPR) repeat protein
LRAGLLAVCLVASVLLVGGCESDEARVASFFERGNEYLDNEQPEEAIIEFKNVLQIDPEHAGAHDGLSMAYLAVEKPREAYWEMSETVRLDPENVDARLLYATVSAAIGDFDLAREQADAILEIDPDNASAYVVHAQAEEARDDLKQAEADFREAIEKDPEGALYRYLLAAFLERHGRIDEAEQVLHDLIDMEESYAAVSFLARLVVRDALQSDSKDRDEEALALLERSVELAREAPVEIPPRPLRHAEPTTTLASNVAREDALQAAYTLLSAFHFDRGRFDKAIEVLEEGIAASESKTELIYQMARLYRRNDMPEKEREVMERATREVPDDLEAQLVLSAYLGQQGDVQGALEAARAAVALDPESKPARLRVAELLVDIGYRDQDEESIRKGREIVDEILDKDVDSPEAHFVRAKIEIADGDTEAAKESLQRVLHGRPDWAQAHFVLGTVFTATNELSRARVEVARAVELDPRLTAARKLLIQLHSRLGEHEFAIEQGRAYLAQQPDDNEVRIIVAQSLIRVGRGEEAYAEVEKIPEDQRDAAALFALGRLDIGFGRVELGAERLRKAEQMSPGQPQVLRALLAVDRSTGDLDASAERIGRAVEAKPDDTELAELQAQVRQLQGDVDGAREAFQRAIELDPRNVSAQLGLAELESRAGNPDEMVAVLERAARAVPESSDLQFRLALVYERQDRRADAIDAYEKAISLNGDLALAKNNLAYLLTESGGDLDRALELAQQAKEALPDDASAADTLGWVLVKRGVPSAAIGYLEEAAERFPSDALEVQGIVRNHLAEAYEMNKEADKAIAESRKVLDHYQQLAKRAREQGTELSEPDWSRAARARLQRLEAAS